MVKFIFFAFTFLSLNLIGIFCYSQKNAKCSLLTLALKNDTVKEYFLLKSYPNQEILFLDTCNFIGSCPFVEFESHKIKINHKNSPDVTNDKMVIIVSALKKIKKGYQLILYKKSLGVVTNIIFSRTHDNIFVKQVKLSYF